MIPNLMTSHSSIRQLLEQRSRITHRLVIYRGEIAQCNENAYDEMRLDEPADGERITRVQYFTGLAPA